MLDIELDQYVYWEGKEAFLLDSDVDSNWILYMIESGSCSFKIGDNSGIARKGDLLLCPPYKIFDRKIREPLTFHFFRFSLKDIELDESLISYPLANDYPERMISTVLLLNKICYDFSDFSKKYRVNLLSDALTVQYLNQYDSTISRIGPDYKNPAIKKAIELLSDIDRYAELSISDIALELNMNSCYFTRKFKKVTGYTPVEYRNKLRLKYAQKLLIETDYTIEKISEECGFCNGFYLSRVFSKHLGVSPGAYRDLHQV